MKLSFFNYIIPLNASPTAIVNFDGFSILTSLTILLNGFSISVSIRSSSAIKSLSPFISAKPPEINNRLKFEFPLFDLT